jgi:RimJ/RimL family protein N-acetyltransferase
MIESRGGESIKGTVIDDPELIELGHRVVEALGVRGPCTVQVFRDSEVGLGITDVNTRFGGAFPAPMYAALPGRTYPELIVAMARGERIEPHVGEFRAGVTFTRYFWQLELDSELQPTGRDIVSPPGPPPPRGVLSVNPLGDRAQLSDGVSLRVVGLEDASELHGLIEANREHLARFMPWAAEQTIADTRAFLDAKRVQLASNDGFECAIVRDGRIIGMVGFHAVNWRDRSTTIGYWLAAGEQGRGLMTAAVRAMVDHAFRSMGLRRVVITAAVHNDRSRAIPQRLGFVQEGTLRQAVRVGDQYFDDAVYAILAEDWLGQR